MPKRPLDSITAAKLADGLAGKVFEAELAKVLKDIEARGDDEKVRKLTVEYTFAPKAGGKVDIGIAVQPKLPPQVLPTTEARMNSAAGGVLFHDESAANFDQQTFDDAARANRPRRRLAEGEVPADGADAAAD